MFRETLEQTFFTSRIVGSVWRRRLWIPLLKWNWRGGGTQDFPAFTERVTSSRTWSAWLNISGIAAFKFARYLQQVVILALYCTEWYVPFLHGHSEERSTGTSVTRHIYHPRKHQDAPVTTSWGSRPCPPRNSPGSRGPEITKMTRSQGGGYATRITYTNTTISPVGDGGQGTEQTARFNQHCTETRAIYFRARPPRPPLGRYLVQTCD